MEIVDSAGWKPFGVENLESNGIWRTQILEIAEDCKLSKLTILESAELGECRFW